MQEIKVITGVERRRRFSEAEKARILEEAFQSGTSVAAAARKYEVSPSLIYLWRKSRRKTDVAPSAFVQLVPEQRIDEGAEPEVIRVHVGGELIIDFPLRIDPRRIAMILSALKA